MRIIYAFIVLAITLAQINYGLAAEFPKAYYNDSKRIVLENEFLRFEIDPLLGGRISSFIDKRDGIERITPGRVEGLCLDQFYEQDEATLSGQWNIKQAKPYNADIVASGPEQAAVKVGRESIPYEREVYDENYDGLYIEKTFTLKSAEPVLNIEVKFTNRSKEGRRPAYWIRSGYVIGGDRLNEQYLRPARRGIQIGGPDYAPTDQMVWDPSYGWTATLDTAAHAGVVWLMDPSRLMMYYNSTAAVTGKQIDDFTNKYGVDPLWIWDNASSSAVTAEWYYHRAFIPAGESWQTSIRMVSLQKINSVSHACDFYIADLRVPKSGTEGKVEITMFQSSRPVQELKISGDLNDIDSPGKTVSLGAVQFAKLFEKPEVNSFPNGVAVPAHAVLRFNVEGKTISGESFTDSFEYIINGDGKELGYRIPAPELKLQYQSGAKGLKPEGKRRVLFLEGLAYERWGLSETLKTLQAEVREDEFMKRRICTAVRYFPVTLKEALQYDLIILAAIDANALSLEGCRILRDYVNNGGSLFILGGLYSWGTGRFHEMGLDDFLPVSVPNTYDLKDGKNFVVSLDLAGIKETFQNNSLDISGSLDWGVVNWYHQLNAKPEAKILLRLGDYPLLSVATFGNGRIACMAGTTLGSARQEDKPFWSQSGWTKTKDLLLKWLLSIS